MPVFNRQELILIESYLEHRLQELDSSFKGTPSDNPAADAIWNELAHIKLLITVQHQ